MSKIKITKQTLNRFITKDYKFGKLISWRKIKKGFGNKLYYLKTQKGEFILKIAIRNSPYRVKYEVEFLNHLKNLPVPKLIKNNRQNFLSDFGKNKAFVYHYLPGSEKSKFSLQMLKQVGEFLARLHLQSINFLPKPPRIEFYNLNARKVDLFFSEASKIRSKKIQQALDYIHKEIKKHFLPPHLPLGAMHSDLKPENVLFDKSKLTGVVDFDNSYNGPLILDLAKTMIWFACSKEKFNKSAALTIFNSYNKIRELNSSERKNITKALHFAILSHTLADAYYSIKKITPLPEKYLLWQVDNLIVNNKRLVPLIKGI